MEMPNLFDAIKNVILQSASCSIKNQILRVGDSAHGGRCHRPPAPISNSMELSNVFNATRNINPKSASSSIKNQAFR